MDPKLQRMTPAQAASASFYDLAADTYHRAADVARKAARLPMRSLAFLNLCLLAIFTLLSTATPARADGLLNIVSYDDTTGAVTFTPGNAIAPVIVGIIAAVAAGLGLFIIVVGVRKIFALLRKMG